MTAEYLPVTRRLRNAGFVQLRETSFIFPASYLRILS